MDNILVKTNCFIKKYRVVILCSVAVFAGILLVYHICLEDQIPTYTTYMGHADEEQFIYNLTDNDVIVQEFWSPRDFDYATLHFSNHDQRIEGKTYVKVEKVYDDALITYLELENPSISYEEYVKLDFGGGGIKNEKYRITISFEGMGEQGLGIMGYPYTDTYLEPCNLSLLYAVAIGTHSTTYKFILFAKLIVFYLGLLLLWNVYVFTKEKWSAERRFLAIAIPVGLFFLLFPAINPVYDGGHHLRASFHYSNYLFRNAEDDPLAHVLSLREDEAELFNYGYGPNYNFHLDNVMLNDAYQLCKEFQVFSGHQEWVYLSGSPITFDSSIMEYFPAVIGITLSRFLHFGAFLELWIARLFEMTFYLGICYLAIRIVPAKKELLAFASLIPMSLCTAAGISYDSIVFAVCILLTALFVYCHYRVFLLKHYMILGICCYILGENKGGVYLLVPLVFLMIPKTLDVLHVKRYRIWITGAVCGLLGLVPTVINVYLKQIRDAFQNDVSELPKYYDVASLNSQKSVIQATKLFRIQNGQLYTIRDVIINPLSTLKMFIISLIDQVDDLVGQAIGNRVSFAETRTSWLIILGFIFLIFFVAVQHEKEEKFELKLISKIWILMLFIIQIFVICLIMFVVETGANDQTINGVQGRYFIPWIALLMLILSNGHIKVTRRIIQCEYYAYSLLLACFGLSYLIKFV